jgi:hypothetical protein
VIPGHGGGAAHRNWAAPVTGSAGEGGENHYGLTKVRIGCLVGVGVAPVLGFRGVAVWRPPRALLQRGAWQCGAIGDQGSSSGC